MLEELSICRVPYHWHQPWHNSHQWKNLCYLMWLHTLGIKKHLMSNVVECKTYDCILLFNHRVNYHVKYGVPLKSWTLSMNICKNSWIPSRHMSSKIAIILVQTRRRTCCYFQYIILQITWRVQISWTCRLWLEARQSNQQ